MLEPKNVLFIIIGSVAFITGLTGWSHSAMSIKVDALSSAIHDRPTQVQTRLLIHDKLEANTVQLNLLHDHMRRVDGKLDRLVEELINK